MSHYGSTKVAAESKSSAAESTDPNKLWRYVSTTATTALKKPRSMPPGEVVDEDQHYESADCASDDSDATFVYSDGDIDDMPVARVTKNISAHESAAASPDISH